MIPYVLHVALLLSFCLLFYKLLLQKETFYRLNRVVLVCCLTFSFVLPLIPIPQNWALRKSIPTVETVSEQLNAYQPAISQPQKEAKAPIPSKATPITPGEPSTVKQISPPIAYTTKQPQVSSVPSIQQIIKWAFYLYWIGVAAFGLNLLLQIVVLLFQAYTKPFIRDGKYRIVELSGDKAPCSFGNCIFINPEKYDWDTYTQILLHEKVHIQQRHSFDIIIAELVLVLQWFNPFAWLYRTEVENNLEFLTDDSVLEHKDIEKASYQMSLLKVSAPHLSLGITTNYNQSLLKRRILMMNAKKSNIHIMWKYFFLIPLLGILACALNDPAAYSKAILKNNKTDSFNTWANITDNAGSWFASVKGEKVKMEFRSDSDEHNWSSSSDFTVSEFSALPKNKKNDFTLTREAGSILFNGKFDGDQGYGHYKYTPNISYKSFLAQHGITDIQTGDEFAFFIINIKKAYVSMLERNGYKGTSKNQLIAIGALKVDEDDIKFWKTNGFEHLSFDQLASAKALGITADYLGEIRKAGYTHLSFDQLVSFKATGVTGKFIAGLHGANPHAADAAKVTADKMTPDDVVSVKALNVESNYIDALQKEGYSNISINELTSMKAVGVTPQFIENLKTAGYINVSARDLVSLRSVGVDPPYVKGFESEGYTHIPVRDLISMKSVGVTHEFINGFKAAGYNNISVRDLVSLKSVGITPAYIKNFEGLGFKNIPVHHLVSMKSVGIDDSFIESFSKAGYKDITINNLISLKSLGVTPEFARSYESVGYKNLSFNQLTTLKALGITPEYIKSFQGAGFKDLSINSYSSLKSVGVTPDFIEGFKKIGYDITANQATSLKANGVTPAYVSEMRDKGFKSTNIDKYIELKNAFN